MKTLSKELETERKTGLKESGKVLSFIKKWQSKNDYNPKFLKEYNEKFKAEFNEFLKNSNFSQTTVNIFKT
jgi:kynurenine formamidase